MAKVFQHGRRPAIITSRFLPEVHDTRKRWGHVLTYSKGRVTTHLSSLSVVSCLCQGSESSRIPLCPSSSWDWRFSCGQLPDRSKSYWVHSAHQGRFSRKPVFVCNFRRCVFHISQCVHVISVCVLCTSTLDGGGIVVTFLFFFFRFNSMRLWFGVLFYCLFRIAQRLGEWCKATILLRTAPRPFLRREIRFLLTAVTLLNRPELTSFPKMLRRGSGVWEWAFSLNKYSKVFEDKPTLCFSLRHLQREIENQKGQAAHIQQQIRRLDEDIRQNQELLRRAHTEQKTSKVKHLFILNVHILYKCTTK